MARISTYVYVLGITRKPNGVPTNERGENESMHAHARTERAPIETMEI